MIIPYLGKLSVAQALTAGSTDSTNVMEIPSDDYNNITDAWLAIDTVVAAGGAGAITIDLVVAKDDALANIVKVVTITIAAVTDLRVATAGRHITAINIGKVLKDMLDTDGSDYEFIGIIYTLGGSATLTASAVLSNSEPPTESHRMVTVSPVSTPSNP